MRLDSDTYREIADALLRNKSRSFLTGFGIFWGIFMLLFLLGGGKGLKAELAQNFEGFATNTVVVATSTTTKPYKGFKAGRRWQLSSNDVARVKAMIPELDVVTPVLSQWGQNAMNGTNTVNCNLKGVYGDYIKVEEPKLKYGRYIHESDCIQNRKVCVIGKRIYTSLFPDGGDPCGQFIQIGSVFYQIVGVDFSAGNISIQGRADRSVSIPLPVLQKVYNRGTRIDLLAITGKPGVKMSLLEPRIRSVIAREHKLDPTDKPGMFVLNTEQIFSLMDNLFKGVNFLIWLVGLGTILAGAIGVSNIMMVTVKERTVEIGIRRAIGATPRDVLSQIIFESILLTLVAGSSGIVFSAAVLRLMEMVTAKPVFEVDFSTAMIAAALLMLLGVGAGLAPALRAMNIKPVEAMRDE